MNENVEDQNVILKLENVYKTYKLGDVETHALKDVNLEIKQGEIIVILGPSGSRKNYFAKCTFWA